MNIEEIRNYVLEKDDVEECFPFGEDTLVFKTGGKMFLLIGLEAADLSFNAKVDPDKAVLLRDEFPGNILPGYHMNKKHWNTVIVNGLKRTMIKELIDDSYGLVFGKKRK